MNEQLQGSILTPAGWVRGGLAFDGPQIGAVSGDIVPGKPEPPYLLPGFIDLHVHGGGGHMWRDGEAGIRGLARFHAGCGTIALAPTTATAPVPAIESALAAITAVNGAPRPGEAIVLGTHLEGPFINPAKLGAQEPAALAGDPALARSWAERFAVRIATVAPEIPGGLDVIRAFTTAGVRCQIAHSLATAAESAAGFQAGCTGFTHLFNAMTGVDHRAPGVAAYALAHATHAEIICDLLHVGPVVVRAAARAIPRLYAISDAIMAGLPDGEHQWGGLPVRKDGVRVTLADGKTLAGSAVTMLDCFRNLVAIGFPLAEASAMTATRQAAYLGLERFGSIRPGARASVVKLDGALGLQGVWIDGVRVGS